MKKIFYVIIIIAALVFLHHNFFSDDNLVHSSTRFEFDGFEEYQDIIHAKDKEEYIRNHNLDANKRQGVIFIPTIGQMTEEEKCMIYLKLFSDKMKEVEINNVSLISEDGKIIKLDLLGNIFETELIDNYEFARSKEIATTVDKSDDWFYSGNRLKLIIDVTIEKGEETLKTQLSFDFTIAYYYLYWWTITV